MRVKSRVRSTVKKFKTAPSADTLTQAYSVLDVAAKKSVIPKKRASRTKSRLASILAKSNKPAQKRARVSVSKRKTKSPKNSSQKA